MKLLTDIQLTASIALTHMRTRLKQTVIATIGVTFGITMFVFMVSFIQGSNDFVKAVAFEQSPHLRLYNEVQTTPGTILDKVQTHAVNIVDHVKPKDVLLSLKDGKQIVQMLQQDHRIRAVSGAVNAQVFYRMGSSAINGIINGIEFEAENSLFNLQAKLVDGSFHELSTMPNSLVMGIGLAKRLNVKTGDRFALTTEKGNSFYVTVVGIFKTGMTDIDKQQSYASLNTVQRFLGVPAAYITDIKIKLHDMELAPALSKELQTKYGFQGSDWKQDNSAILEGDALRKMIVYSVAITILLVAGFGIFNILTMMIYEKMKDIAILKAMGFSDADIRWIFLIQALIIGIIGALLGLLFGFLCAYGISKMPYKSDVMITLDHLPVSFNAVYYTTGFSFGILTTALAGYLPSRKAAHVDPITILRG
ncbi:lipoprotein-releasing system permease protein [Chitinophaga ginsengisegetis]|uniref:Lipoprotein-releasing system permease protein n=1 Tax=Chitinophaga ginsengisegetis TaxID=393003 RepID=A0A1T5NDI7_9BACT|nr:FtsX-like permease family protein [Chitinophaga ginsengisegetis]SKC98198.1 lipoprotein-releasing system permease protein [Chitinophaga ginsengisegetis]